MQNDFRRQSAAELGRRIGAGELDPVDLTDGFLEAARDADPDLRIFARMTETRARAEAAAARDRARSGQRVGPLDGVPISWKDLFDTAGVATESGSALLKGRTPDHDAEVLRNATAAGLICLGKTHQTELAFSGLGLNPVTSTPPNVNDESWVPGGSSSGAAASVAFGLAAAGIGSDTGGSVRIPSAWNDLVGLKTTSGRLPLTGVVPLVPSFDTVGPLCRTVKDAGLLLSTLEGRKPADLRGASLSGVRLAVLNTVAFDGIRDAPARGFEQALGKLANAGARITDLVAPEVADAMKLSGLVFAPEAYAIWSDAIEAQPDLMYEPVRERFRAGKDALATDVHRAWDQLDLLRAAWADRAAPFDAVLVPTAAILPPDRERLLQDQEYFTSENLLALRNTRIGNLLGLCALTLPTGVPSTGISLMGRPGDEESLLRLGLAAEKALA